MQWSKIKNIIILLLAAVNLLLLGQVVLREMESANLRRQAREDAVALLASNGIQVDPAALPEDRPLGSMRCERDGDREAELASALLGEAALQESGGYAGPRGRIWFYSSGDFNAELEGDAYPLGDKAPESVAAQVMEKLDFQGDVLWVNETDGAVSVRVRQSWEGVPIFSCEVTLTFEGGGLRAITGRRLPGTPAGVAGEEAMTVTTALIRFLSAVTEEGYVRSQVKDMTAGYEMTAVPTSGAFKLTPVWQIETDASPFRLDSRGGLTQITE